MRRRVDPRKRKGGLDLLRLVPVAADSSRLDLASGPGLVRDRYPALRWHWCGLRQDQSDPFLAEIPRPPGKALLSDDDLARIAALDLWRPSLLGLLVRHAGGGDQREQVYQ